MSEAVIKNAQLTPIATSSAADRRQLAMVTTACNLLGDRVTGNAVTSDVLDKVGNMVAAINNRNFSAANAIQAVCERRRVFFAIKIA